MKKTQSFTLNPIHPDRESGITITRSSRSWQLPAVDGEIPVGPLPIWNPRTYTKLETRARQHSLGARVISTKDGFTISWPSKLDTTRRNLRAKTPGRIA